MSPVSTLARPSSARRTLLAIASCLAVAMTFTLGAHRAAAAEEKASFNLLVAELSNTGNAIDPRLQEMAKDFKRNGLAFSNYKLLHTSTMALAPSETGTIRVSKNALSLTLLAKESDGKLKLRVATPSSTSEISIPPKGEVFIEAGNSGGAKLFLIVRR